MTEPVERIRELLREHAADMALIIAPAPIRWATGFSGSNGLALIDDKTVVLITDPRYAGQAPAECPDISVEIAKGSLYAAVASHIHGQRRILFDDDILSVSDYGTLAEALPGATFIGVGGYLGPVMAAKRPVEIDFISRAQAITDAVFEEVVRYIRPGRTESEVAAEIVCRHLQLGAARMSFDPIVAAGPNGARPHARPGDRKIAPGDAVVIDMGCHVDGYASDMTRTVFVGEAPEEFRRMYDVVLRAKRQAVMAARCGMRGRELDSVARSVIDAAGLGEYFVHSLGHGVGLNVHEWPRLSSISDDVLPENAVVTIEPGVYLPGRWGIRIEDLVVLRRDGCTNLTASSDELIEIRA